MQFARRCWLIRVRPQPPFDGRRSCASTDVHWIQRKVAQRLGEDAYWMDGAVVDAILPWSLGLWHVLIAGYDDLDSVGHINALPSV